MQMSKARLIPAALCLLLALAPYCQSDSDTAGADRDASGEVVSKVLDKLQQRGLIEEEEANALNRELAAAASDDSEYLRADWAGGYAGDNPEVKAVLAAAIVALFGTPVLIVGLVSINNYRRRKLLHDNINKLIEQGRDLPPELLKHFENGPDKRNDLDKGMKYIALGLGIGISLSILRDVSVGSLGLIPLFLGLAHLLIWKLDQLQANSAP